jgi:hypothetical protein
MTCGTYMSSFVMFFFHGRTEQGRAEPPVSLAGEGRPRCRGEWRPRWGASSRRGAAAVPGSVAGAAMSEGSYIEQEGTRITPEGWPQVLAAPSRSHRRCWPRYPLGQAAPPVLAALPVGEGRPDSRAGKKQATASGQRCWAGPPPGRARMHRAGPPQSSRSSHSCLQRRKKRKNLHDGVGGPTGIESGRRKIGGQQM